MSRTSAAHQVREIHVSPGAVPDAICSLDRASRLPPLYEVARDLPSVFAELDVCVVGVGSIGTNEVDHLARLGVRSLLLVDPARYKLESLITHPCTPADVGRPKVVAAGERAKALSPGTRVFVFERAFEDLPLHSLAGSSFVLLASDNLRVEAEVGRRALEMGIPLLQASVYGPTLSAQVRVFAATKDGAGPCPMCGFGRREFEELDRGTVFSCGGASGPDHGVLQASQPTSSLPQLCAIAANLCTLELTRRAVGIADPQASSLVEYCGFNHTTTTTPLERRLDCPQEHLRMRLEPVRELDALTPSQIVERAGYRDADPQRITIALEGFRFASLAACGCTRGPSLGRFLPKGSTGGTCSSCGQDRVAHPLHVHEQVRVAALGANQNQSLASLGARRVTSACIRSEQAAVLFHQTFPATPGSFEGDC